ncbi:serine hydrolase [bacterium]|nr:serine hydrolase [bacterium]
MTQIRFFPLLLILLLTACSAPPTPRETPAPVRVQSGDVAQIEPLLTEMASVLIPAEDAGIVVAFVDGDAVTFAFVGNPNFDEETLFEYGSITKVLTANVLVQLAEEGVLNLDDSLNQFLPETLRDPKWDDVTLRHLATHTAGLPGLPPNLNPMMRLLTGNGDDPYADYDQEMLYAGVQATSVEGVGETWAYSNYGFALLGYVLSRQSELVYADLIEQRILDPLAMDGATIVGWSSDKIAPPLADDGSSGDHWTLNAFEPAGALRGDLLDGVAFLQASMTACQGEDLVSRANCLAQQSTRMAVRDGEEMGIGWVRTQGEDGVAIWHNGGTGGYSTFLGFNPETQIGVVFLYNVSNAPGDLDQKAVEFLTAAP